ncbi:hypothetical protein E2C01_090564 [Portunus trituberculatus]|uniref:Uncharacterized protein n=1 Tax=Portunus trituberculatus TaxID=210409 RepID=A0A5B7JQF9_PORTR|nr:hypothetical protein [Portunus trituberculatus]
MDNLKEVATYLSDLSTSHSGCSSTAETSVGLPLADIIASSKDGLGGPGGTGALAPIQGWRKLKSPSCDL